MSIFQPQCITPHHHHHHHHHHLSYSHICERPFTIDNARGIFILSGLVCYKRESLTLQRSLLFLSFFLSFLFFSFLFYSRSFLCFSLLSFLFFFLLTIPDFWYLRQFNPLLWIWTLENERVELTELRCFAGVTEQTLSTVDWVGLAVGLGLSSCLFLVVTYYILKRARHLQTVSSTHDQVSWGFWLLTNVMPLPYFGLHPGTRFKIKVNTKSEGKA